MTREELIKSKGYWIAKLQTDLYRELMDYIEKNHITRSQLAKLLDCSEWYVSQLLNNNLDYKISKLVEISLAIGKVPVIEYKELSDYE